MLEESNNQKITITTIQDEKNNNFYRIPPL